MRENLKLKIWDKMSILFMAEKIAAAQENVL